MRSWPSLVIALPETCFSVITASSMTRKRRWRMMEKVIGSMAGLNRVR